MEYESNYLKLVSRVMMGIGTWPMELPTYAKFAYRTYHVVLLTYYSTFAVTLVLGNKYTVHASPVKQAYMLQYSFTYAFLIWKVLLSETKSIRKLIKVISHKEKLIMDSNDDGVKNVYKSCLKHNYTIFYLVFSTIFSILILFCSMSYFEVLSWPAPEDMFNSTVSGRELRLSQMVPFEIEKHFELVFYFQASSRVIAGIFFLGCDSLWNSLIYFPAAYLRVLGYKFEHFGDKTGSINPDVYIKSLILEHKEIIQYVIFLNNTVKWLLSIDFFLLSYHISLTLMGIMALLKDSELNVAFMITLCFNIEYLVVIFLQMSCLYYNCNELILQSLEIPNSIFRSNWYEQPFAIKQGLSIITMKTQKPLEIRVGNLYTMSNDFIIGFAKAGFTYILLSLKQEGSN